MNSPKYIIDTNILIRRSKYDTYEEESFPIHWENFDRLVDDGVVISTPSVFQEISKHEDEIYDWAVIHQRMFEPPDEEFILESNFIKRELPRWYHQNDDDGEDEGIGDVWADRDLVIHAKSHGLVLVTLEDCNLGVIQKNYKIPTVCKMLGAYCVIKNQCTNNINQNNSFQCIDFHEFIKREELYIPKVI